MIATDGGQMRDGEAGGGGGMGNPDDGPEAGENAMIATFAGLTEKQHEVLRLVAESRSSKEIAWSIGISESAVNQRIEAVRRRAGGASRAQLARGYRRFQQGMPGG